MQPLWFGLNSTEDSALSAGDERGPGTNVTDDNASIVSNNTYFDNTTEKEFRQVLKKELEHRHSVLLQWCSKYDPRITNPFLDWRETLKHLLPGPLMLFKIKKVLSRDRGDTPTHTFATAWSMWQCRHWFTNYMAVFREKIYSTGIQWNKGKGAT